ncbi:hypothetical protein [Blastopirellula marina]|uniref:Uncharacterized protein n=1 Tax=Blastopirellula marina TaxID=124 RepID=A0A2S8FI27_9BACT|nr:hypothetical protein [Blastopirellula marina]PQO31594.1 hypothetical protein C5Y98_19450 [Blastopirellula marina]PTL42901.1 hypothetical protein C5Y97_19460 [Blastopirellula marina]
MYQSEPNMAFGILLVALLGMLVLGALSAVVVGLVLVATKGGRILVGIGLASLFFVLILAGGLFRVVGYRTTEVIPSSVTQVAEEPLRPRAIAPPKEIPLDAKPADEAAPQPKPPQEVKAEVEELPPEDPQPSTPARTLSSSPDYPFPDVRPPNFPSNFGPFGPNRGGRFASSASPDPHAEIQRLREQAMNGLYERMHGIPTISNEPQEPVENEPETPSEPIAEPESIIPPGRPAWVEQAPVWEDDGTCLVAVSSGPFERGMDCRKTLENETRIALREFTNDYLDNAYAAEKLGSQLDELSESVVVETYREELNASVGPMQQWHSLLKFDGTLQQKLRELWLAQRQVSRIVYIGAGFLGLLGILSIFYVGMSLTGEGTKVSPWLVSAGTVVALGGLLVVGVIFVQVFPML